MSNNICGICRETESLFETRCGYHFHCECKLKKQKTCPYCRTKISSSKKLEYTLRHYDGNQERLNNYESDRVTIAKMLLAKGKLIKKLISLGADTNAQDFLGRQPLHYLLIGMRKLPYIFKYIKIYKIIAMLISAGANINAQTHLGTTDFHYIKRDRELNILKKFIEMGVDIFKAENKRRDLELRAKKR